MFRRINVIAFTAFIFLAPSGAVSNDKWDPFIGIWEYRQENIGTGSGFDAEGERIEFQRKDSLVIGLYFGVEREGEHGLFYSAVEIANLSLDDNGKINFTIPGRELFSKRPSSVEEAGKRKDDNDGYTGYPLLYSGFIANGALSLTCSSQYGNCPDGKLDFYKGKWK